jgi:hypothetical protein
MTMRNDHHRVRTRTTAVAPVDDDAVRATAARTRSDDGPLAEGARWGA